MTRIEALRELLALVEDDDPLKPTRIPLKSHLIETALNDLPQLLVGAYEGSVTDAIALAEGMIPDVDWIIWSRAPLGKEYACRLHRPRSGKITITIAPRPARAMLIAVLRMLIKMETDNAD